MSPGDLDAQVIRRHLLAIDEALQVLASQSGTSSAELARATERRWIVERGLQLCAQNALDVATHIAASRGRDAPDYASAIDALGSLGVLPAEFADRFRGVAGFRNILVHAYLDIDPERLRALLARAHEDFGEFARHVEDFLASSSREQDR